MSPQVNFDAAAVPESENDFALLPEAWYRVAAVKSELKPNSKGTGSFILFEFDVLEGSGKGRKLWSRFTWEHTTSQQAVDIGHRQFADLCEACGKAAIGTTEELHNRPFDAHVKVEEGTGKYKDKNVIADVRAASSGTVNPYPPVAEETEAKAAADVAEQGWG